MYLIPMCCYEIIHNWHPDIVIQLKAVKIKYQVIAVHGHLSAPLYSIKRPVREFLNNGETNVPRKILQAHI